MAPPRPTFPGSQPPPDLPHMPEVGETLSSYLRNFALWAKNITANKLDTRTAQPRDFAARQRRACGDHAGGVSHSSPDGWDVGRGAGGYWGRRPVTSRIKPLIGMPIEHVLEAPMDGQAYVRVNGQWAPIVKGITHDFRVRASDGLNNAVANGGILRFDIVDLDSDGFAPTAMPFSAITIPDGLDGIYVFSGWSSSSGDQSTSMGMGVLINGINKFSDTNQTIWGPGSVDYQLDNGAVEVLRLVAGDTLQLINNSVSSGANVFTSVTMAASRIEPGLQILSALTRPS